MKAKELTVCDVMGEWGLYQWSVTLFAVVFSALFGLTVVVGPIWTPEMSFVCAPTNFANWTESEKHNYIAKLNFTPEARQCSSPQSSQNASGAQCETFIFDDAASGRVLTNSFDLVCEREWLRSFLSSSALAGMLLSSLTLGRLSDKYGRMACIHAGVSISILATLGAILSHNYLLLNLCFFAMSFGQVGAANSLSTLVMESTTPKFRSISIFEYGFGWALGILLTPLLHQLTLNYVHALLVLLAWQLLMLPWMHFGVHESIRWLLSEGQINKAQIELQRACRINRVRNGAGLAQDIAKIQAQQMRKASRMIEADEAPKILAKVYDQKVDTTARELDMLSAAIKQSFGFIDGFASEDDTDSTTAAGEEIPRALALSPTLSRLSFCIATPKQQEPSSTGDCAELDLESSSDRKESLTTQGIIQLAMKYKKTLAREEEGSNFLVRLFHKKLWRSTVLLACLSVMLESSYYGFIQANRFVGSSVTLNYVINALLELVAAFTYWLILYTFSRRVAITIPISVGSLACLLMAAGYHLIPNQSKWMRQAMGRPGDDPFKLDFKNIELNQFQDSLDSAVIASDQILAANLTDLADNRISASDWWLMDKFNCTMTELLALRDSINWWLMNIGKFSCTVGIQIVATIGMETYPNNLRQTGSGALVFVGRIGSIVSPFLFNDTSEDRIVFKSTLVALGCLGFAACALTPWFIGDAKERELCDHMEDIEEDEK